MSNPIPYGKQEITEADVQAVSDVLRGDFLTQGPLISSFEKKFGSYIGSKKPVAVSNGTAALHLAAIAMNVHPGDTVLTSPLTFSASANCISYCGGKIIFEDIDPDTGLLDLKNIERVLEKKPAKGVIPVSYSGLPYNTEALANLIGDRATWTIEDACHAPGGSFISSSGKEIMAGSSQYTDAAIFSFHPVKHIATGEGGMITAKDPKVADRLKTLRTHGITKQHLDNAKTPWYYEMLELGYNYRLTDIQAALGISQLERAEEGLKKRRTIANRYTTELANVPIKLPTQTAGHAYHLYVIRTPKRDKLYHYLHQKNIKVQVHYVPVHWMPYYQQKGWKKGDFPIAEKFYSECLSLPMFPSLTDNDQGFVIDQIKKFFQ